MVKLSRRFKYAVIISAVIMSSILMYKLQWDSSLPAVDIEQGNKINFKTVNCDFQLK